MLLINDFGQVINYLKTIIPPDSLTPVMELILKEVLLEKSYSEIAEEISYDANYIKRVAAELWQLLSQYLNTKITKKNFHTIITEKYQAEINQSQKIHQKIKIIDWNACPILEKFYGRNEEIKQLKDVIFHHDNRLISLLGLGGIGKTALSVKFAQQYQEDFEVIIWRSLRNAPPLNTLITDLVTVISKSENLQGKTEDLLTFLQNHHCLILLDNFETILESGKIGYYRSDFENYGNLIRFLGESDHQSRIIITSREKSPEVNYLEGKETKVKSIIVQGCLEASLSILEARNIQGNLEDKQYLTNLYDNSPLAIKIIATSIQDLFNGDIQTFLLEKTFIFNGLNRLLDEQFTRLSTGEKTIMNWLAINRELTSIQELEQDIFPPITKSELLQSLESLIGRSLIEQKQGKYTQQAVIMEYVLDNLINEIYQELIDLKIDLFGKYSLNKTTVKKYVTETQKKLIIEPLVDRLKQTFPVKIRLQKHLQNILHQLKNSVIANYGVGNLINIYNSLKLPLKDYDFSELPIWQTDLSQISVKGVNFSYADFKNVKFLQNLALVLKVAYHPQGEIIANSDIQKIIHLWRVSDGQTILKLIGHQYLIWDFKFSADGKLLVSASDDKTVKVWDINTGNCLANYELKKDKPNAVTISKDNKIIMIGTSANYLQLWYWQENQHQILKGHQGAINSLQLSGDEKYLFTASLDHTIKQWDLAEGKCIKTFESHVTGVKKLSVTKNDQFLLSVSLNGKLKIWSIKSGQCLYTLGNQTLTIFTATFDPTGKSFITASGSILTIWDTITGSILNHLTEQKEKVISVDYSPDGKILITGSNNECTTFVDVESGHHLKTLSGYSNHIWALSINQNNVLASGGTDSKIRLWSVEKASLLRELNAHKGSIYAVQWHPDGRILASCSSDSTIKFWDGITGECLQILSTPIDVIFSISWHPQGDLLAIAGSGNKVYFWQYTTNQYHHELEIPTTEIMKLVWSNDGNLLALDTRTGQIFLYDLSRNCLNQIFQREKSNINDIRNGLNFSQDHAYLAFSSDNAKVEILHLESNTFLASLKGHLVQVVGLIFIKQDQLIVTISLDSTVRIWELLSGKCLHILTDHQAPITSLTIVNEDTFATGSADSTIRIWDVNTAKCIQVLTSDRPYEGMNVYEATGLTSSQLETLTGLGAIAHSTN